MGYCLMWFVVFIARGKKFVWKSSETSISRNCHYTEFQQPTVVWTFWDYKWRAREHDIKLKHVSWVLERSQLLSHHGH